MEDKNVIGISAPVGSGKTELATILGKVLDTKVFYEPVDPEDNPVLKRFYGDKSKYGFLLQMFFLDTRFGQIKEAYKVQNGIIDSTIYTDRVFLNRLYKDGEVTKEEVDVYNSIFNHMMEEIEGLPYKKTPDLMISINLSIETEVARINHRNREFEQGEDQIAYWDSLLGDYREWVSTYDVSPIHVIDGDKYDFVNNESDRTEVVEGIIVRLFSMGLLTKGARDEAYKNLAKVNEEMRHH